MSIKKNDYPMPFEGLSCSLMLDEGVFKHGFMWKKSGNAAKQRIPLMKEYEKRYVILHKGWVYYFKDKSSTKPQKKFSLENFSKRVVLAEEEGSKIKNVFKIFSSTSKAKEGRTYYFATDSIEEMNEWMECFKCEIDKYNVGATKVRPSKSYPGSRSNRDKGQVTKESWKNNRPLSTLDFPTGSSTPSSTNSSSIKSSENSNNLDEEEYDTLLPYSPDQPIHQLPLPTPPNHYDPNKGRTLLSNNHQRAPLPPSNPPPNQVPPKLPARDDRPPNLPKRDEKLPNLPKRDEKLPNLPKRDDFPPKTPIKIPTAPPRSPPPPLPSSPPKGPPPVPKARQNPPQLLPRAPQMLPRKPEKLPPVPVSQLPVDNYIDVCSTKNGEVMNEEENYVDAVTSEKIPETETKDVGEENCAEKCNNEEDTKKSPEMKPVMKIKETSRAFEPEKPAVAKKPVLSPQKPPVSANKPAIGKKPLVKPVVVSDKPKVASSLQARMKMFEQN